MLGEIASTIFVFWVILLPLIQLNNIFEGIKIIWFLVGGLVLAVFWIFNFKKLLNKLTRSDLLYFSWVLTLLISSFYGIHPIESIIGTSYRHQGVIFFLFLWLTGKTLSEISSKSKNRVKKLIFTSLIFEAFLIFIQKFFGMSLIGTFGEINAASGFIAIGSIFVNSIPLLILLGFAILMTSSRTALLAAISVLIIKIYKKSKAFSIILIIFALIYFVFSITAKNSSIFEGRINIWQFGIELIKERPILGFGPESGEVIYKNIFAQKNLPLYNLIIDRSHNLGLDLLQWSGIPGLITFSLWLFSRRNIKLIPFLIFAFFQPLGVTHWVLLMILVEKVSS